MLDYKMVNDPISIILQGAPETIQERLINVPAWYVETYKKHTRQGSRVLALAYKSLPDMTVRKLSLHPSHISHSCTLYIQTCTISKYKPVKVVCFLLMPRLLLI